MATTVSPYNALPSDCPPGDRMNGLRSLIGNTPLLGVEFEVGGERRVIYAKAEHLNLTGSTKDRMALHILARAYASGKLRPGQLIAEATSGNTGISFAALGRALGHHVHIFMPDWMSRERVALIESFGAHITHVTKDEGGFVGSIARAEALARESGDVFLPAQFANEDNSAAHETSTGPELWTQLLSEGRTLDAFVAGVGTGGTIMGVGRFLRSVRPEVAIHPLEPAESPTLSTGHRIGKHRIQGISDEFIPPIVELQRLDEVIAVSDGDAIIMARRLAAELGLGVGISSGANFLGALEVQNRLGPDAVVATVFPDSNKKYLSTDLLRDEPVQPHHRSPAIRLCRFWSVGRVCHLCANPVIGAP